MKKIIPRLTLFAVLSPLLLSREAPAAQCSSFTPAIFTLSPPTLTTSRDVAPGTVLWSSGNVQTPNVPLGSCVNPVYWNATLPSAWPPVSSLSGVYQTNVSGIGVKVVANYGTYNYPTIKNTPTAWNLDNPSYEYFPFVLQIVVTGPVPAGTFTLDNPVVSNYATAAANTSTNAALVHSVNVNAVTVVARSCATQNVTVDLGKHMSSEFSGVGSTSAATTFSIALNGCPAGMASIKYQIDPTTAIVSGTGNSVVTLATSSSASNIGVQLLDGNGNPLTLSTPVTFSGYKSGTGGSYTIPLKARYYQTGTRVGPGSANTALTFTLTYQ